MLTSNNIGVASRIVALAAVAVIGGCATATSKPDQAAEPEPAQPAEPETKVVTEEVVLDTRTLFAFDSDELTAEGRTRLDELVRDAGGKRAGAVSVTGHTDRIGPEAYNRNLSERRASSVADYMARQGVPETSITVRGMGESQPVTQCEDQNWDALVQCLAPNRRVVVEYPVNVEKEVTVQE